MAHLNTLCESGRHAVGSLGRRLNSLKRNWRFLVPSQCPLCSGPAAGGALCLRCGALVTDRRHATVPRCARCCLVLDEQEACPDCAVHLPAFDRIIAAFDYRAPADVLIHRLKVMHRFIDAPMLGRLLADEVLLTWPDFPPDMVVVPVPSSRQAIRRRGFNPAAEVARVLASCLERPYCPGILQRAQEGQKQAMLSREQRMISTSRLYRVAADVHGVHVAVVDDVLTTGSTMHSIARMLKQAGATSVHGVVLARTPRFPA